MLKTLPSRLPAASAGCDSVVFVCADGAPSGHDTIGKAAVAASLARLLDVEFHWPQPDECKPAAWPSARPYFVPSDTLCASQAQRLGVSSWNHLFGGVVGMPFMATKVITHPLVGAQAAAPGGWARSLAEQLKGAVLDGYSVFDAADAREAGRKLLAGGAVRVKDVKACGGAGQSVLADTQALDEHLAAVGEGPAWQHGLVLERNLNDVHTLSVGQVRVGPFQLSYHGSQQLTTNHRGRQVYGGSTLHLVRGDFDALLRLDMDDRLRTAIEQALHYHRATMSCLAGVYASRSNYDIAQGVDDAGVWRSGVLEQSWRIGGASGAEVVALHAFRDDPALRWVKASTHEVYAECVSLPPRSLVLFDAVDAQAGRLTKYATVQACGDD